MLALPYSVQTSEQGSSGTGMYVPGFLMLRVNNAMTGTI